MVRGPGSAPFRHVTRRGPRLLRADFESPCEALGEREEMLCWAERAVAAARRWRMRKAVIPGRSQSPSF